MPKITLKRELGLFHTTACGVGLILGAGIYVLIGEATADAGNSVWLAFLISAVVSFLTGLSYAELSSMFPKDSAEYTYTEKAFGKNLAFLVGYFVVLSAIIGTATVATGFASYFSSLFQLESVIYVSVAVIAIFSFINYRGIKAAAWTNVVFTAMEIIGLFIIIAIAVTKVGSVDYFEMPKGFGGVMKASALVFFAFLGFESVVKLSEECKNPRKTIPRALLLSLLISTVLYVAVSIAAVSVLDWQTLGASKAPLADVAAAVLGSKAFIVLSVIALFSTANTVLISLLAGSRTLYGISENYKLLKPFQKVNKKRRTPHMAILAIMVISILFALIADIGLIAELTNFTLFITFGIINLSVIVIRFKYPKEERRFKMPLNIGKVPILAVLGFISCAVLMAQLTGFIILGGLALCASAIIFYFIILFFERRGFSRNS